MTHIIFAIGGMISEGLSNVYYMFTGVVDVTNVYV